MSSLESEERFNISVALNGQQFLGAEPLTRDANGIEFRTYTPKLVDITPFHSIIDSGDIISATADNFPGFNSDAYDKEAPFPSFARPSMRFDYERSIGSSNVTAAGVYTEVDATIPSTKLLVAGDPETLNVTVGLSFNGQQFTNFGKTLDLRIPRKCDVIKDAFDYIAVVETDDYGVEEAMWAKISGGGVSTVCSPGIDETYGYAFQSLVFSYYPV